MSTLAGVEITTGESGRAFALGVVDLDPPRAVVHAVGEFDIAARQALTDVLHELVETGRRIIRLDASRVTFLDCSCLGVLVEAHHRLLDLHGLLIVAGATAPVARILAIPGLQSNLFIVRAEDDGPEGAALPRAVRNRSVLSRPRMAAATFDSLMLVADQYKPRSRFRK